jgi:hypothetical protein
MRLTFNRNANGDVVANITDTTAEGTKWQYITISANDWINIVASMAKDGETVANSMFAKNLHEGNIHSIALLDNKYKQIIGSDIASKPLDEYLAEREEHY